MIRFLDTNIFVAALRGTASGLRERIMAFPPNEIRVSHQVLAELLVGAAKSARPDHHRRKVEILLEPFEIDWPDSGTTSHYVDIRTFLEKRELPSEKRISGSRRAPEELVEPWSAAIGASLSGFPIC